MDRPPQLHKPSFLGELTKEVSVLTKKTNPEVLAEGHMQMQTPSSPVHAGRSCPAVLSSLPRVCPCMVLPLCCDLHWALVFSGPRQGAQACPLGYLQATKHLCYLYTDILKAHRT